MPFLLVRELWMRPDHFGLLVMSLILSITAGHFLLRLLAKKRFTARGFSS
uniref:Uncharacterized protein n=1 Tax=Candidatus Kentrum sp. LFY TaxID=2126342 RepID=A0A450WSW3_9GAMM|nr:MAG: hypothetical protein BECKLFY1418C_GA0070996_106822 [Candidatus Kentron sp. LFY]